MEVSHGDPRRFGLILASVFVLAAVILGIGFVIRLKTPFEQEQARAEATRRQRDGSDSRCITPRGNNEAESK